MGLPAILIGALAKQIGQSAAEKVVAQVTADPVVKNEMNAEPWWQSRVALGSIVAALGVVLPPLLALFGVDTTADKIVEFGTAVVTLGGALFALYGRFVSGLKPLFSRKG